VDIPYDWVNPYPFSPPIAPCFAAKRDNTVIQLEVIANIYRQLVTQTEIIIVEGVGGWSVPINSEQELKDLVQVLDIPVILVVGLRLGCINHALLTAKAILQDGCHLAGWIANPIDPEFDAQESVELLSEKLAVPLIQAV
jgi:dethiobiotin synthetase